MMWSWLIFVSSFSRLGLCFCVCWVIWFELLDWFVGEVVEVCVVVVVVDVFVV